MNIKMSYIDYNSAGIDERSAFSFTKTQRETIYENLKKREDIYGSVLISTCNRTELYLSLPDESPVDPFECLCNVAALNHKDYLHMAKSLCGDDAILHLCRVASGAESQILGDDQIISQVRDSAKEAGDLKATDTILNVVFRTGISAGKKVKTLVDFKIDDNSSAILAAKIAIKNNVKNAMVIGNGMIGRLVTEALIKNQIDTVITLRQYRYSTNIVPDGARTVNYKDRYDEMSSVDAVISATTSPHYTVSFEEVCRLKSLPKIFIDLAVPRDIDPKIEELEGLKTFDMDNLVGEQRDEKREELMVQVDGIIEKYMDDFHKWYSFREKLGSFREE